MWTANLLMIENVIWKNIEIHPLPQYDICDSVWSRMLIIPHQYLLISMDPLTHTHISWRAFLRIRLHFQQVEKSNNKHKCNRHFFAVLQFVFALNVCTMANVLVKRRHIVPTSNAFLSSFWEKERNKQLKTIAKASIIHKLSHFHLKRAFIGWKLNLRLMSLRWFGWKLWVNAHDYVQCSANSAGMNHLLRRLMDYLLRSFGTTAIIDWRLR